MKIFFSEYFKRQLKKLCKKYPNAKEDLLAAFEKFDPENAISIGRSIFKIRIASSDIGKGKSSGFRAYLYVYVRRGLVSPLCVYAKTKVESISENELKYHFDAVIEELLRTIF